MDGGTLRATLRDAAVANAAYRDPRGSPPAAAARPQTPPPAHGSSSAYAPPASGTVPPPAAAGGDGRGGGVDAPAPAGGPYAAAAASAAALLAGANVLTPFERVEAAGVGGLAPLAPLVVQDGAGDGLPGLPPLPDLALGTPATGRDGRHGASRLPPPLELGEGPPGGLLPPLPSAFGNAAPPPVDHGLTPPTGVAPGAPRPLPGPDVREMYRLSRMYKRHLDERHRSLEVSPLDVWSGDDSGGVSQTRAPSSSGRAGSRVARSTGRTIRRGRSGAGAGGGLGSIAAASSYPELLASLSGGGGGGGAGGVGSPRGGTAVARGTAGRDDDARGRAEARRHGCNRSDGALMSTGDSSDTLSGSATTPQAGSGVNGGRTDSSSDAALLVKDQVNVALQAVADKKHGGYALRHRSASAAASGWFGIYFDPTGGFRRFWDAVLCVLLLYVATFSVFVYCFYARLTPSSFFFWMERVMDAAFATDILLCFVTGYVRHDRVMETRGKVIAARYSRTWLVPDILSTLPWDALSLAFSSESGVLFKLLRFLRLLRLSKLVSLFRRARMRNSFTRVEVRMHIKYAYLRMLYLLGMVLLLAHWIGCLFYFIGSLHEDGEDSWLLQDDIPDDLFGRWVASVFFSAGTLVAFWVFVVRCISVRAWLCLWVEQLAIR